MEIWKDIPNYSHYQVSNLGRVKSLKRIIIFSNGRIRVYNERILKSCVNSNGYNTLNLSKKCVSKSFQVGRLVAVTFLNHKPNRYKIVIDHINNIRTDDRVENLQLITPRENTSKDRKGYSSKYIGVSWSKNAKKWVAQISVNGKIMGLGCFINELDASQTYQNKLLQL